jgi:signal transduction histidine kinase
MSSPFTLALREFALRVAEMPAMRPAERVAARRLSRDLEQLAGSLEGRPEGVDLLSVICHDLKDPLASLTMGTGFLGRTGDLGEASRRVVAAMARSTERMDRIVTDLHELARFEAGRVVLELQERDLAALLRDAAAPFAAVADERGLTLDVELPAAPLLAKCDPARLEQALECLLGNAVRATPAGGRVVLSARVEPPGIRVAVTDTGARIPADRLKGAFDHLPGARRARDGVGLDLAIARAIVELHGGTIHVEASADDQPPVTTFAFTLPPH